MLIIIIVLLAFYEGDPNITDDGMVVWCYDGMVGGIENRRGNEDLAKQKLRNQG